MFVPYLTRPFPVGGHLGIVCIEGAGDGLLKMNPDRGVRGENAMVGEAK